MNNIDLINKIDDKLIEFFNLVTQWGEEKRCIMFIMFDTKIYVDKYLQVFLL